MKHLGVACATLCLLLAVPQTIRADLIYTIQNYPGADQNRHTVTGTITTDLPFGFIGPLTKDDIKSWTVTFDQDKPEVSYTFSSADIGATVFVAGVQATSTNLTLSAPTGASNKNQLSLQVGGGQAAMNDLQWSRYNPETVVTTPLVGGTYWADGKNGLRLWYTPNPSMGGTDPWVLAMASGSAVPEPASLWMLGIATGAGLAYGWSRRRRAQ